MARNNGSALQYIEMAPAISPEARESRLVSMSMDLVEQRLRDGTASSQETTHFLKRGSQKEQLEIEKLKEENALLKAKTETLKSAKRVEELYEQAIKSMKHYAGQGDVDEY